MDIVFNNAAPRSIDLGYKDNPTQLARMPASAPQHLAKILFFAERGGEDEWMGGGADRMNRYGAATFEERGPYYTHQTRLAQVLERIGNMSRYKRLVPTDAGPASNATLWIDLLPTKVDRYEHNEDGSIKTLNGQPVIIGEIDGYTYFFHTTFEDQVSNAEQKFGRRTIEEGTQVDPTDPSKRSKRYPLMEMMVSSRGKWGNNAGVSIWGLDTRVDELPLKLMKVRRAFPYRFQMVERDTETNSVSVKRTINSDQTMLFTMKPYAIDPSTNQDTYFLNQFKAQYFNTDERYPRVDPDISRINLYQDNIENILTLLHAAEVPYIDQRFHDFTADPEDKFLFNLFGGSTSNGFEYESFRRVVGGVNMNRYERIYLNGGSDGTMNREMYEKCVVDYVRRYQDADDILMEKSLHNESQLYDTGFTLETKLELAAFISIRKDTFISYSTFQEGERSFDRGEELSIAQAIRARLMSFPDSHWFGTEFIRGSIVNTSCEWRRSVIPGFRVSPVLELAHKRGRRMGAQNGRWTPGREYDKGYPGSLVEETFNYDKDLAWVPESVRFRYWDAGIMWFAIFDDTKIYCPAFRTVYSDETSPYAADSFVQMCIQLNKVNYTVTKMLQGTIGQSDAVFTKRGMDLMRDLTRDRFDNAFPIEPDVQITESDRRRGSVSWTQVFHAFADPMKTVGITYIEAHRTNGA